MTLVEPRERDRVRDRSRSSSRTFLFGATAGLAALLMFTIEPLAAKRLLPDLGGSAAVWNTAMAFFQVALLLGYLAAHVVNTVVSPKWRLPTQLLLLVAPLLTLPLTFPESDPSGSPVAWELMALTVAVGAPFFGLASLSPTIQRWLGATNHPRASDPFFLYAASNIGSFAGLLAYPLLIEPNIGLARQADLFTWAYTALVGLALVVVLVSRPRQSSEGRARPAHSIIPIGTKLRWVGFAAVPALMLMAVTRHLATDVASFPLLWVVPLAIYLGTFVVAFSRYSAKATAIASRFFPLFAVVAVTASAGVITDLSIGLTVPLLLVIASGLMGHGRLFATRPDIGGLTGFYLWISVGGAVGGMFGALAAPTIFDSIAEYPIALVATAALLPAPFKFFWRQRPLFAFGWAVLLAAAAVASNINLVGLLVGLAGAFAYMAAGAGRGFAILLAGCLVVGSINEDGEVLARERTFYGVYKVLANNDGNHVMVSGTTIHGVQQFEPSVSMAPLAYYIPEGPIGQLMATIGKRAENIAIIGLGAGVQATFLEPGQHLTYYEIDPTVGELASDPGLFTYLAASSGTVDLVYGDGRLALEGAARRFDLLMMDAFTSDAIPTHLLTVEATELYLSSIRPGGVVAFHISNRHLDLEPVLGRLATNLGLEARIIHYNPENPLGSPSTLVVMALNEGDLAPLIAQDGWRPLRVGDDLWTDDFTNILGVIR